MSDESLDNKTVDESQSSELTPDSSADSTPQSPESAAEAQAAVQSDEAAVPVEAQSQSTPPQDSDQKSAAASQDARPPSEPADAAPTIMGTIRAIRDEQVHVDLAGHKPGVCPVGEFRKPPRIGQRFEFTTVAEGEPAVLALAKRPSASQFWKNLERGAVIDALVTGMNTGGLELKIPGPKVRAFMPNSQIDFDKVEDLAPYLNRKIRCKVLEINRRKRSVVLSHRAVVEQEQRRRHIAELKEGQVIEGVVRRIESFGVFIEIQPGLDGLVRLPDLSWNRFDDPAEVVKVGDKVPARVLKVDAKHGKVALGVRQATENPWKAVAERYPLDSEQTGVVTRITDFGAFVELEPGIEGLIHISQLSERRVERVEQAVREGQRVKAKVVQVDAKKHRIGLSIRALTAPQIRREEHVSREDMRRYVKSPDKAKAVSKLMLGAGDSDGLKGGIG